MELRTLQHFVTVAELLNFSAAAERLGVSQPAVSRQIQLMERELGVRLFDRVGRKVSLTPDGRDLLERSYEVRKVVESLTARAGELSAGTRGTLRIGATPQTLESLIARILPGFIEKHPEVRIALVEDGSANLARALEHGDIHLAVGALGHDANVRGQPLFPLIALVAIPRGHRLAARRHVEVEELAEERLLLLQKHFMTRQLFDGACQVAGLTPRILLESASPHCLLALVESGLGLAVVPSTVRFARGAPRVVPLVQNGRPLGLWMHALWDARRYAPPPLFAFIKALADHARRNYPGKSLGAARLMAGTSPHRRRSRKENLDAIAR